MWSSVLSIPRAWTWPRPCCCMVSRRESDTVAAQGGEFVSPTPTIRNFQILKAFECLLMCQCITQARPKQEWLHWIHRLLLWQPGTFESCAQGFELSPGWPWGRSAGEGSSNRCGAGFYYPHRADYLWQMWSPHCTAPAAQHLSGLLPSVVSWCVPWECKLISVQSLWWLRRHLRPCRAPGSWLWTTMIVLEIYRCAGY